jgi:serine/threonine protein kinase
VAPEFPRPFGNYTLLAEMPKGGMGALYLGCRGEGGMEKLCVVKTVLPHLADKEYTARFKDEAKVVVRLSHGNIVPVFDAGFVGQELFMAMELVDGKDLRAVWNACAKKGIAFPVEVAVYVARELARGLHHAHTFASLKLVHRDMSPPNVMLSYFGEVKLTDFGLASSTLKSEKTAPGIVYGKISYMSPEQAKGEPLDGRTDLYAVGIILWELLTGRQMFPNSAENIIQRVRNPETQPPSVYASRVPPALDAIVMKSLAKDRTLRYADCEAFRSALAGFLATAAPTTDNASVAEFLRRLFGDEIEEERTKRQALLDDFIAARAGSVKAEADQTSSQPTTVSLAPKEPPQGSGVIGTYLDGRYLVRRLIGEGGMGLVYEAEHVEIGRRVAVKILHAAYTRQAEVVARFRSEARAATRIGHPHIIDVFDSGTTVDGAVYFVMEYLDGVDLGHLIGKGGPLPVERAVRIAREICQALAAAHKAGIVHRDMKPENVFLVERDGQKDFVKVLDFGIAKTLEAISERQGRLTNPGMAMGTPEYMAPEQAAGANADGRADVYAVGAILYEMLTGRPPHEGNTIMEVLTKKATERPVEVETLRPDVPLDLARLVQRCLATSPDERPQSMEALATELGRLSGPAPKRSLPPTGTDRVPRKSVWPYALVAGAGAAALTGALILRVPTPKSDAQLVQVPMPKVVAPVVAPPPPPAPPPVVEAPKTPKKVVVEAPVTVRRHAAPPVAAAPAADPAALAEAKRAIADAKDALVSGRLGQAQAIFEQVRDSGLEKTAATLGLAQVAFQKGDYQQAIKLAKGAGSGVGAKMVIGNSYLQLGQYDSAISQYREVLRVDANHSEARNKLAQAEKRKQGG